MDNHIFTKKQFITIMLFIILLVGVWGILAFFIKEEYVTRFSFWASMVFGTGSIITSVLAIGISVIALRREEFLRRQKIEEEANRFINQNANEIEYIPLCLLANAYDNHHRYVRNIYNSFNVLRKEIQKEVLKQLNYDCSIVDGNQWIDKSIELVRKYINENDLGKDFLYDGAKFFHRAMNYSSEEYDSTYETAHIMPDYFSWNPKLFFEKDKLYQENITFYSYLESYLYAKNNDKIKYALHKSDKPLTVLSNIFDFGNCEEDFLCFWAMQIVESITILLINEQKRMYQDTEEVFQLSKGDAEINTFEDKYLDVLMKLYNLYLMRKQSTLQKVK